MKYIITIGREYGSGGRFIAKLLAKRLGINYYDNELLTKISEKSGLAEGFIKQYDEKKETFFNSGINPITNDVSLGCKVFLAQFDAIKSIAEKESCIIVGRSADYILKDYPNVLSIFITAPMEDKIERATKYYNIDPKKAEKIIKKKNKQRKEYYEYYTDKLWGHSSSYDICINSKIGVEACVDVLEAIVKERMNIK
ncbi:MAG: cytidylate kinase-like family protein [Bacilli bacterium]|nr:cytidylate kinase-like family protein [Bacilli bacterium]